VIEPDTLTELVALAVAFACMQQMSGLAPQCQGSAAAASEGMSLSPLPKVMAQLLSAATDVDGLAAAVLVCPWSSSLVGTTTPAAAKQHQISDP
jgi:hypothetical protein